ncbi:MAG: hypothetical protein JW772_01115 [Candidatus Diapherotrites archaeon]|nr:hypothetical protein [Candidatus Diapherotrites archaeon]
MELNKKPVLIAIVILMAVAVYFVVYPNNSLQIDFIEENSSKGTCNRILDFCRENALNEDDCYNTIVAALTSQAIADSENCASLKDFYRDKCYADAAESMADSDPIQSETICNKIIGQDRKAECFTAIAVISFSSSEKAISICRHLNGFYLDECLVSIAKKAAFFDSKGAYAVCAETKNENTKIICEAIIISASDSEKARELCSSFDDEQEKQGCLSKIN